MSESGDGRGASARRVIQKAIEFVVKAHAGQVRKGTAVPYVVHPLGVAKILTDYGCSNRLVVAGLLHDTLEDTRVTLGKIRRCFGDNVARLVEAVSEPDKQASWEVRKLRTIESLKTAPMDVLLVACADKLDNIRAIREDYARVGTVLWARFNRPRSRQRWYYRALADVFVRRMDGEPGRSLSKEFRREVVKVFGGRGRPAPRRGR